MSEEYLGNIGSTTSGGGAGGPAQPEVLTAVAMVGAEVGELRAHLQDALNRMFEIEQSLGSLATLAERVTDLSSVVARLLGTEDSDDEDDPLRPVDLGHVPTDERAAVLAGLVTWVRDVLLLGWPSLRTSLRPCWVFHPDLVNALLFLRTSYLTAYDTPGARAHHAADFRRALADVAAEAEQQTRECDVSQEHALPSPTRDDSQRLGAIIRRDVLVEITGLLTLMGDQAVPVEHRQAAQARVTELAAKYSISQSEAEAFRRQLMLADVALNQAEQQRRQDQG